MLCVRKSVLTLFFRHSSSGGTYRAGADVRKKQLLMIDSDDVFSLCDRMTRKEVAPEAMRKNERLKINVQDIRMCQTSYQGMVIWAFVTGLVRGRGDFSAITAGEPHLCPCPR